MSIKLLQIIALGLTLSACASNKWVESINQSQSEMQTVLFAQDAQLQQQSQRIEHLELLQGALNNMLSEMSVELDIANERLAEIKRAPPPAPQPTPPQPVVRTTVSKAKPPVASVDGKTVLGRTEWVWVDALDQSFDTELNTGMRNSVIYVSNSQVFERDGQDWVRFELMFRNSDEAKPIPSFEAPVIRMSKIRLSADGQYEKRPTIKTTVRIGALMEEAEFVLTPVAKSTAAVVLGRNFLRDIAVVDVARKYTQPKFKSKSKSKPL